MRYWSLFQADLPYAISPSPDRFTLSGGGGLAGALPSSPGDGPGERGSISLQRDPCHRVRACNNLVCFCVLVLRPMRSDHDFRRLGWFLRMAPPFSIQLVDAWYQPVSVPHRPLILRSAHPLMKRVVLDHDHLAVMMSVPPTAMVWATMFASLSICHCVISIRGPFARRVSLRVL